ncbi:hypothetical protein BDZ89DRAFT_1084280 [Hymenopellis radicata]|nr:hypothetical protein BDZ89DRAFT_1084280 [Hymenopellis radicata]
MRCHPRLSAGDDYAVDVCDETSVEETQGDEGSYCTWKMENMLDMIHDIRLARSQIILPRAPS